MLSTMAAEGISYLFHKVVDKQQGSGLSELSTEEMRTALIEGIKAENL
jgi:hypothetical protein